MAYARIVLHFFLEKTFPLGFLSTFNYTPEGGYPMEVVFSYSVSSQQKLTTSMIREIPDDKCDTVIIPVPNDMVGDPMDLLRTASSLGKRALESMPQQDYAARKAAKSARAQRRNAKRVHQRQATQDRIAAAHSASLAAAAANAAADGAGPSTPRS